ncbi:alpha-glucuronidase family glycosyl hydrolase [Paenibacillus mendelii]|uniref:Alpha-glucuronidase family glycosyl hydrolase n=1 Tax=Paenibacillus mendelii TaxID=206163 RepID=A0ABV6JAS1_9BACL|nr:alpha-glucuronidase family glycosyl hydrolase [Paenibacillus mendelii]MCQ6563105.1 hypothetical protein [Paenibacillus mendelii]
MADIGIGSPMSTQAIDLTRAVVLSASGAAGAEAKAIEVLIEEVAKRSGVIYRRMHELPGAASGNDPIIVAGSRESLLPLMGSDGNLVEAANLSPEGYILRTSELRGHSAVMVIGADARGVLYGIGKLLRQVSFRRCSIQLSEELNIVTSPRFELRGHQLGYRPKTNAYDAWTLEQYDQYIRELALFGANCIEILPPRTDDAKSGPLMKADPLTMMVQLSETIHSYGLDTWVWYPNIGNDYVNPASRAEELAEREEIFRLVPHIQAVFIPGSDPGDMEPDLLFEWTGHIASILSHYHPEAKIWLSPQVMMHESRPWLDSFYAHVEREPEWLGGIVFGPHVDDPLPELRRRIPAKYPIRRYEDITHNFICQYPVADWDVAFALTLGRECYNPRPLAQKQIHNVIASHANGSICYSEGINDDVNKFIWLDQDWNPSTSVMETLRDYARVFIGPDYADSIACGLMAQEENWALPLAVNDQVEITLQQWRQMERHANTHVLGNYRFQMGLLRAYYDAYTKRRLIYETELEYRAKDALRMADQNGSLAALEKMERILGLARAEPVAPDYQLRCQQLADELFAGIGSQLTVSRHYASHPERGAFIEAIDFPLNDIRWLRQQSEIIREEPSEAERLVLIEQLLDRTNPGPGGYYDNLGSPRSASRIESGTLWENDPGYLSSPRIAHMPGMMMMISDKRQKELGGVPLAWENTANIMLDTPLTLSYDHLSPGCRYAVKITYIGESRGDGYWVTLTANDEQIVHENLHIPAASVMTVQSEIPPYATANGKLQLTFRRAKGFKRLHVAEIWLIVAAGHEPLQARGCEDNYQLRS